MAERLDDEVELVTITTSGDRGARTDKSRFVKEIEEALLAGEIDLAVHSAKDVPGELPAGLSIVGVPERADPHDALCGADSLDDLAAGAVVGTASVRRRAQLLALRDDLEVRDLRGNVDTRLRRLAEGTSTRSCSPGRPGAARARRRGGAAARARPGARSGLPRARGAQPTTSAPPPRPRRADRPPSAHRADRRARPGHRAERDLQHADRRPRPSARRGTFTIGVSTLPPLV